MNIFELDDIESFEYVPAHDTENCTVCAEMAKWKVVFKLAPTIAGWDEDEKCQTTSK